MPAATIIQFGVEMHSFGDRVITDDQERLALRAGGANRWGSHLTGAECSFFELGGSAVECNLLRGHRRQQVRHQAHLAGCPGKGVVPGRARNTSPESGWEHSRLESPHIGLPADKMVA